MHDLTLNNLPLIGSSVSSYIVTAILGLESPPLRVATHESGGEDGGYVSSIFYGSRLITIEGTVTNRDATIYQAARQALEVAGLIYRDKTGLIVPVALTLTTNTGLSLTTNVYPKAVQISLKDLKQATFQLQLLAPDPVLYGDAALTTGQVSRQVQGGATFPLTFPITFGSSQGGQGTITNAGNLDTWPIIYLRGALTSPRLYVVETGATFKLNFTTTNANDVITIDMRGKTIMLNGTTSLLQYRDAVERGWFSLPPLQSTMVFTTGAAGDTGTMEVTARSGYVGV